MTVLPYKVFSNLKALQGRGLKPNPKISVFIGFYNNIALFDLLMASFEMQTFKDFEVLIGDDGSRPEVVAHIQSYMKTSPFPVQHLWHADDGWRKVEMLNKALMHTSTDYMITIDQDCILHPEFIREHFKNREPNTVLAGRRVELSPFLSRLLTPKKIRNGFLQKNYWWMFFFLFFISNNQWIKGLYIKTHWLRKLLNRKYRSLVGCNMSFYVADMININGYDMFEPSPCGAEDADVEHRLKLNGVRIKPICNMAVQYHHYHKIREPNLTVLNNFLYVKWEKGINVYAGYDLIPKMEKSFL